MKYGDRRVRRLANGESARRSQLDADSVTRVLREVGAAALRDEAALTLVLDGTELRRPEAEAQEHLMRVKARDGRWVKGYRSVNVLGMGEGDARGLLYHRLFSSAAPGFASQVREEGRAIDATEQSLSQFAGTKTWVMDRGYDNDDVWWQVWRYPQSRLVCRVFHFERVVEWQNASGQWEERYLDATCKHLVAYATVETRLRVRLHGQPRARRQQATAHISAVPLRVWAPGDRRRTQPVWLVKVAIAHSADDAWYLLTDWPVTDAPSAIRVFTFYCRRWAVEDTFKFIKTCFGAQEVRMLGFEAIRTLVAFAWVAAGFLFHLGLTLDDAEVQLLARLGGWEPRADRPPGKQTLTRGLRRLLDLFATEAILMDHLEEYGALPPFVLRLMAEFSFSLEH